MTVVILVLPFCCLAARRLCRLHQIGAPKHPTAMMYARRKHGRHDLCTNIVQRLGENAHGVARGRGVRVLKRCGENDALAGEDGFVFVLLPSIQECLELGRWPPPIDR